MLAAALSWSSAVKQTFLTEVRRVHLHVKRIQELVGFSPRGPWTTLNVSAEDN